jgi:hypothetical protein
MRTTIHPAVFLSGCIAFCALWLSLMPVEPPPTPAGMRRTQPSSRATVDVDRALLERYVGRYRGRGDFTVDMTLKDGRLYVQSPGTIRFEMLATSERNFFLKESPEIDVQFRLDGRGTVTGFDATTPYGPLSLDRTR